MDNPTVKTVFKNEYEVVEKNILDSKTQVISLSDLHYFQRQLEKALSGGFENKNTYLKIYGYNGNDKPRVAMCVQGEVPNGS